MLLKQIQDQFQDYLMHGHIEPMLPVVSQDTRLSANRRLGIYFDAYRIRLMEILKLDFPKTHTLLGDSAFEEAFLHYLAQYPSEHFSVRYFGSRFPQFLAKTKPYSDVPVLAEMANFELAVSYTLDAQDGEVVYPQDLAKIPGNDWPYLVLSFHPSVTSLEFAWDTPALWQHIENDGPPRKPEPQTNPIKWLFWRSGIRSLFQSCTPVESKLFDWVKSGIPFGEICENLMDIFEEDQIPLLAAQTLNKWVQGEMISTIGKSKL